MRTFQAKAGSGKYVVEAMAVLCGPDVSVCICGGTHPHIGASALGLPCESLKDSSQPSASVSVLNVVGHKEDQLAKEAAFKLTKSLGCRVSVSAGLHVDHATQEEIQLLWNCYEQVLIEIEALLKEVERGA